MTAAVIAIVGLGLALLLQHRGFRRRIRAVEADARFIRESRAALERSLLDEVRKERRRLVDLIHAMQDGVVCLGPDGKMELSNTAFGELFGDPGEGGRSSVHEVMRRPELISLLARVRSGETVPPVEMTLDGQPPRTLHVTIGSLPAADGAPAGQVVVFHDVTRLKQFENTRREFVANVSHELRTPLSIISGFVETLLAGAVDDPETARRFLTMVKRHGDRLADLVEDLLALSRLESGHAEFALQPTGLHDIAALVLRDMESRARTRQVTVVNEVPAHLEASADPSRLEQVLLNLLDNAIRHGRAGGFVRVGGGALPNGWCQLWVEDDGPGIPEAARERVFERFYRLDTARARETGGTGLGLSIVKHIVQRHGGEVWVQNGENRGCRFSLTLPPAEHSLLEDDPV